MPHVHIRVAGSGASAEQKAALIAGATRLLAKVLGKDPAATSVTIEEIPTDNWGVGGESVTARRRRSSNPAGGSARQEVAWVPLRPCDQIDES